MTWFKFVSYRLDSFCACTPKRPATGVPIRSPTCAMAVQSFHQYRWMLQCHDCFGKDWLYTDAIVSSTARFAAETFAGVWHLLWQTYSAHRGTSAKDWSAWHIICKTATYVLITSPVQVQLPAGHKNGMINFCIFTWTWEHLRHPSHGRPQQVSDINSNKDMLCCTKPWTNRKLLREPSYVRALCLHLSFISVPETSAARSSERHPRF